MKIVKYFALVFLLAYGVCADAQKQYEPQILILSPGPAKIGKPVQHEIDSINKVIAEQIKSGVMQTDADTPGGWQPENVRRMLAGEDEFSKNITFVKQLSWISEQYLAYRFIEHFPDLLILLKDRTCAPEIAKLRLIAEQEHLQYVLNFPSAEFSAEHNRNHARVRVQLYDNNSGKLVIDRWYSGDGTNHGFEFACEPGSLSCTINNVLSQALDEVRDSVIARSPTVKKERRLAEDRYEVLMKDYYSKSFDGNFVKEIVADPNVNLPDLYQCMTDPGKTKFVAFFIAPSQKSADLLKSKKDRNVTVQTSRSIHDSDYLGHVPQMYAYTVCGVKYKGKWYWQKTHVVYFEAENLEAGRKDYFNSLQSFNFFKEGSVSFNSEFWETAFFEKVRDIRKDPDWDKYGTTIFRRQEEEDRPYIGMYKIVADEMKNAR